MIASTSESPLRVWALTGARAGDNNQVIALAQALGLPFETKHLEYNGLRFLGPRLLGRSLLSVAKASRRLLLDEPPPDLTISAGHRSVPVTQALRARSSGRTRSIHVGFPRVSPSRFDLVIATPQYPIADHPNLLAVPYALTTTATREPDASGASSLSALPSPRRLLLVGGPNIYWKIDDEALLGHLAGMLAEASMEGGSVLVTTSPRTPARLASRIRDMLSASEAPWMLATPGKPPAYASLLDAAHSISVTADSVAMVSDAIWTGKPVALVNVTTGLLGRVAIFLMDRLWPGRPIYPQDLRFFWHALTRIGVTERLSLPTTPTSEELYRMLARVEPILDELRDRSRATR